MLINSKFCEKVAQRIGVLRKIKHFFTKQPILRIITYLALDLHTTPLRKSNLAPICLGN
jgi:hypothetical protein